MTTEQRPPRRPPECPPALWDTLNLIIQDPNWALRECPELLTEFAAISEVEAQT